MLKRVRDVNNRQIGEVSSNGERGPFFSFHDAHTPPQNTCALKNFEKIQLRWSGSCGWIGWSEFVPYLVWPGRDRPLPVWSDLPSGKGPIDTYLTIIFFFSLLQIRPTRATVSSNIVDSSTATVPYTAPAHI